jgi:hypothetical protein
MSRFLDWYPIIVLIIWLIAIVGYILNIAKIIGAFGEPITGMFLARCFGAVAVPLGAILGFF